MISIKMLKHYFVTLTLTILKIIHISVQQPCEFSCLSEATSDVNCTKKLEIKTYATIDKTNGIVDFQFDFECGVEIYEILIGYKEKKFSNFRSHSSYEFTKTRYSNETDIVDLDKCAKTGRVFFYNIQTGFYEIEILIKENGFIIHSNISYWQTSYMKHEINLLNTNMITDSRINGSELIITIKNPILNFNPEFSIQFECKNCPEYIKEHSYALVLDETNSKKLILDPKHNNTHLNISCSLNQKTGEDTETSCVIFPVTAGHYNIVTTFVGERYKCGPNYLWNYQIRIKNIIVKADKFIEQHSNFNESIIGPTLGVINILLSFCIFMLAIKFRKFIFNGNTIEIEEQANISVGKIETQPNPDLLLLYARNSEVIMATLTSFRNIFINQGIEVYDVYDPERLSEINENSFNWILNLISRKYIKIIVFLTPSARNLSNMPQMQNSIDNIFQFAMKYLLNQISNDSEFYKKVFVAHFGNDLERYSEYDLFCPYLRFRIPDDLMALLQSILDTEHIFLRNNSINEYNKLKENYEKHKYCQENINHM